MNWCCQVMKNLFEARHDCGEYVVAGFDPLTRKTIFVLGFNLCHRRDYSEVVGTNQRVSRVIKAEGISNVKLAGYRATRFCHWCGTDLRQHYGHDGGLLRDDAYVKSLRSDPTD